MRRTIGTLTASAVLVASVALYGCSGPGVPAETVRGTGVRDIAGDHLTAMTILKGWLTILHTETPDPPANGAVPEWDMEFLPDGSMRMWGTFSDGGTFEYAMQPDESGAGRHTTPDGRTQYSTWTPPEWEGLVARRRMHETFWDGMVLEYELTMDFDCPTSFQTYDGTATLPDGRTMQFLHERLQPEIDWAAQSASAGGVAEGYDHLRLALPDGSRLEVRIPLVSLGQATYWPVFSRGAEGMFMSASGGRQQFTLTGEAASWDNWTFTAPDGTQGAFVLGADFRGSGLMTRGDRTLGALRWSVSADGDLDLLDAGTSAITPSAAARDFQIDRWVSSIAALGPAPLY